MKKDCLLRFTSKKILDKTKGGESLPFKKQTNTNKMNTFTVTFKNALGEIITEQMHLDFITVSAVISWFEDTFGLRIKSITKH